MVKGDVSSVAGRAEAAGPRRMLAEGTSLRADAEMVGDSAGLALPPAVFALPAVAKEEVDSLRPATARGDAMLTATEGPPCLASPSLPAVAPT